MEHLLHKKEIAAILLKTAAAFLALIALRLSFDQWQSYEKGVESLERTDYKNAIMYFDRVLNAHMPFSPLESKARKRMLEIAEGFEKKKEYELALLCYETVRTSRYLARHFAIPDGKEISLLNSKIASIKAQLLVAGNEGKGFETAYKQQMDIMAKDFSPSMFWSAVAVSSLFAYIGLVTLWIVKRRRGYAWAFCLAFAVWLAALYNA